MKSIKTLTKVSIFFNFIFIFVFIILSYSELRCSNFFNKLFDDILGIEIVNFKCNKNEYLNDVRYSEIKSKINLSCPSDTDVIILIGQSNSANYVIDNKIYQDYQQLNYYDGKCYVLSNPVLGATFSYSNNYRSSIAPLLSQKIIQDKPTIFLTNGYGGTSIKSWADKHSNLNKFLYENIKEITNNRNSSSNKVKYVIFFQGEADSNKDINYKKYFKKFYNSFLKNFNEKDKKNIKFIISLSTICFGEKDLNLYNQQKELLQLFPKIIGYVDTDKIDKKFRYDGCHFNKEGIEIITNEIAEIINSDRKNNF